MNNKINKKAVIRIMETFDFLLIGSELYHDEKTHNEYDFLYFKNLEFGLIRINYDRKNHRYSTCYQLNADNDLHVASVYGYNIPNYKYNLKIWLMEIAYHNKIDSILKIIEKINKKEIKL